MNRKFFVDKTKLSNILNTNHKDGIEIVFHPIIDMNNRDIIGYETLSRGIGIKGELISPVELFSIATIQNVVLDLDRLCRYRAIEEFSSKKFDSDLYLFLNINSLILEEKVVGSGWIYEVCNNFGLNTSRVVIEFSESKFPDIKPVLKLIEILRKDGFQIAIDDFGSAYSNFKRLINIEPDFIKIDRELIKNVSQGRKKQLIVSTIYELSCKLDRFCIAEGVESLDDIIFCYKTGIKLFQGYFFAIPLNNPSEEEIKNKIRFVIEKLETS